MGMRAADRAFDTCDHWPATPDDRNNRLYRASRPPIGPLSLSVNKHSQRRCLCLEMEVKSGGEALHRSQGGEVPIPARDAC